VLYSDGVTEQQNENNQHFGIQRFFQFLSSLSAFKPKVLIEKIEKNLDLFQGNAKQADDITILVLQFKDKKKV
jgi:sigma-B regulation protein RsbU (phosphoserine phosphatase)